MFIYWMYAPTGVFYYFFYLDFSLFRSPIFHGAIISAECHLKVLKFNAQFTIWPRRIFWGVLTCEDNLIFIEIYASLCIIKTEHSACEAMRRRTSNSKGETKKSCELIFSFDLVFLHVYLLNVRSNWRFFLIFLISTFLYFFFFSRVMSIWRFSFERVGS